MPYNVQVLTLQESETAGLHLSGRQQIDPREEKQEACSSSANRAKRCKFRYALFRDYRHTRASRLLESE